MNKSKIEGIKLDDIIRITISFYDPKGLRFVGGFDAPFSRDQIFEYRQRICRIKSVIPGLYGMGVRKPITKIGYITKAGMKGHFYEGAGK